MANKIVAEGLKNNLFKEFNNLNNIQPEVFYNKETRFDFLVSKNNQKTLKLFLRKLYIYKIKQFLECITVMQNNKKSEFTSFF